MYPSSPLLVSKRLQHICSIEDLTAENRALNLLAEICKGDLRSCLNALQVQFVPWFHMRKAHQSYHLQFIKMKSQSVTESIVRTATIGVKEADTSIHSVWTDLLHPISKKRAKNLAMTEEDERKYVSRIARSVEGSGNFDKVVLGALWGFFTFLCPDERLLRRFSRQACLSTIRHYTHMSPH
jgi:chromosome transmission fidelity protein 18